MIGYAKLTCPNTSGKYKKHSMGYIKVVYCEKCKECFVPKEWFQNVSKEKLKESYIRLDKTHKCAIA